MSQWPARLVLVGAGKMGGAMAHGWLEAGLAASSLTIVEPNPSPEIASLAASRGLVLAARITAPPPDMLALAVQPQGLEKVAPEIASLAAQRTLVLSILAGKTIANLEARLPEARAFVRAMPNTPAAIGRGVTAAFANTPRKAVPARALSPSVITAMPRRKRPTPPITEIMVVKIALRLWPHGTSANVPGTTGLPPQEG